MIRVRIMNWKFSDPGPRMLMVSNRVESGFIVEDRFDIEYDIKYNVDKTVDMSAWRSIKIGYNSRHSRGSYVEVTEEELALLMLINC